MPVSIELTTMNLDEGVAPPRLLEVSARRDLLHPETSPAFGSGIRVAASCAG